MLDLLNGFKKWVRNSRPESKLVAGLMVFSLVATILFFIMSGATNASNDPTASTPFYLFSVFIKLIGVLLLIFLCAALYQRWMKQGPRAGSVQQLKILETVRLGPKQALYLVAVGDQQLLIGATDQNISLLTQVESGFSQELADGAPPQSDMNFGSLIQSFGSIPPTDKVDGKE
ncbi:MAG: flagellar biosynthetic protein FliO [Chloroflexota bacterium]